MNPNYFVGGKAPADDGEEEDVGYPIVVDTLECLSIDIDGLPQMAARHLSPEDAAFVLPVVAEVVQELANFDCMIEIPAGAWEPGRGSSLSCIRLASAGADFPSARKVLERAARLIVQRDPFCSTDLDRARELMGLPDLGPVERRMLARRNEH